MGNSSARKDTKLLKEGAVDKHSVECKWGEGKWARYYLYVYESGVIDICRPITGGISRTVHVDKLSDVKPMIASDKRGRSLFVVKNIKYKNRENKTKRGDMFCFAPSDAERDAWIQAIKSPIAKKRGRPVSDGGKESRIATHNVKFSSADAARFMAMQDKNGEISTKMYEDGQKRIATFIKKTKRTSKPAGLDDVGIGAFMFKSLISRHERKAPKVKKRKPKSNRRVKPKKHTAGHTRADRVLKNSMLTEKDRKRIKEQQRGHHIVAKMAAASTRRRKRTAIGTRAGTKSNQPSRSVLAVARRKKAPAAPARSRSSPMPGPVVPARAPKPVVKARTRKPRPQVTAKPKPKKNATKKRMSVTKTPAAKSQRFNKAKPSTPAKAIAATTTTTTTTTTTSPKPRAPSPKKESRTPRQATKKDSESRAAAATKTSESSQKKPAKKILLAQDSKKQKKKFGIQRLETLTPNKKKRKVKKTVKQIEEMLRTKGFNLHRDCSNFDPKKGKTTMEGSVKCGAKLKDNPYVIFLYKKPNAVAGLAMTKEKMRSEIADYRYMREAGLPLPEIYSDVFDCKVNGTRTFGFLVEVVHTSMHDPYKPQAHKVTIKNIRPSLEDLTADQLQIALNDLEMIGEYTKNVHFVHDLQLLCQDCAPDETENGRIFVIDPGELRAPKRNQMKRLQRIVTRLMTD